MLVAVAAALLFASTGVANRHLEEVVSWETTTAWVVALLGLFFLYRFDAFASSQRALILTLTIALLNVAAQATGGVESPVSLLLFVFLSLAAWNGRVKLEMAGGAAPTSETPSPQGKTPLGIPSGQTGSSPIWGAFLYCALEALSFYSTNGTLEAHLYLRWLTFLLFAFLLGKSVKVRSEKDRLEARLKTIEREADRLAESEPSSLNIPKDKLLKEEARFSARLGSVMELEDSLTRILDLFRRSMGLQTVACFLLSPLEGKMILRLRAYSSQASSLAADVVLQPGETLIGLTAKEGRRILLNEVASDNARALPYYHKPSPIQSLLTEPLALVNPAAPEEEPESVGVLVFDSLEAGFFTPERQELVSALVRVVAETIQSVRILHFSSTKTRNMHALYEVSKRYSSMISPDEVIRTILQTAKDIFPCDSAYVALAAEEARSFDVKAWWGTKAELSSGASQPAQVEEELAAWIWQNKKPIRYTRGTKDASLGTFLKKEGMLGSTQSFLMVPLISGENVLGVLRLNSKESDVYHSWDEGVLSTLANQAAMALEKSFLVAQMEEMAVRDGLTGVFNHRYFQGKMEEEVAKAERYNKDMSLLFLDVDFFKKFNDTYGHPAGDHVLKTVAGILKETVRQKVDTVARYGGEEFAVILPESDSNAAFETAERIRKRVESQRFEDPKGGNYRVTVSLGVAAYPFDARVPAQIIHSADVALYESKEKGRNRVTRFSSVKK